MEKQIEYCTETGQYRDRFDRELPAMAAYSAFRKQVYADGALSLEALRMVDHRTNVISTTAGKRDALPHRRNDPGETDPLKLNLPKICSLDYHQGFVFIPEGDDDLIILEKTAQGMV
jgi:hypothetical protein